MEEHPYVRKLASAQVLCMQRELTGLPDRLKDWARGISSEKRLAAIVRNEMRAGLPMLARRHEQAMLLALFTSDLPKLDREGAIKLFRTKAHPRLAAFRKKHRLGKS